MLEVKNLIKIYRTKGGAEVRALDDVSAVFPDKGMVFLLGRSGSGKSTLLNMCGGLDAPDGGEIIVKGRSSKDFSASDFDSYRNTYVGFIFQEYNILSEFSVEDNIALALELQGKPKDKQEIAKILEQVDLTDFAKRKPNTLSGGQKQRVAIARALVKNPEIIMADEPTGALDSNTGKQVLDTLKKLSEDKLVIVVSHDREFAEEYGDRIIELKDGKIISDVVKDYLPPVVKDDNVSVLSDNTLFVKKGSKLTDKDFGKIKKFVAECGEDVLISRDKTGIDEYKKANKITADNSKECFKAIDAQPAQKTYSPEENKFIRSKLPLRHAVKIGASGIKTKPVRFAFTIFLSVVSFVLFGLFSCLMLYDAEKVNVNSIKDAGIQYLDMYKLYEATEMSCEGDMTPHVSSSFRIANMSDSDYDSLKSSFGDSVIPVYKLAQCDIDNLTLDNGSQSLYNGRIYGFVPSDAPLKYLAGRAPLDKNSIAISQFLFDTIKNGKLKNQAFEEVTVNTYNDISIKINGKFFSVSGIFACENVPLSYAKLSKEQDTAGRWSQYLQSGFYGYAAVAPSAFESFSKTVGCENEMLLDESYSSQMTMFSYTNESTGAFDNIFKPIAGVKYYDCNLASITATGNEKSAAVVRYSSYFQLLDQVAKAYTSPESALYDKDFADAYYPIKYSDEMLALCEGTVYDEAKLSEYAKKVLDVTNPYFNLAQTGVNLLSSSNKDVIAGNVKIVGFFLSKTNSVYSVNSYISEDIVTKYKDYSIGRGSYIETITNFVPENYSDARYSHVFVSTDSSTDKISSVLKYNNAVDSNGVKFNATTGLLSELAYYNMLVQILSKVFLWIGIVLAVFSMLLLFNFITASISAKKKEIGILRAVGAKGTDVFKIFFAEAAIVALICIILSVLLTGIFAGLINDSLAADSGVTFSLFDFGILSVAMITGIAVLSAFVSTFVPVYANSKKKPVESIRSL